MEKHLSIVPVDKRNYRKIAQENWGLSDAQMKGMHVHHRIPVSQRGSNDPSNLYVCSPSFHANVWHNGIYKLVTDASKMARLGGLAGGSLGGTTTKSRKTGIFAPGVQSRGGKIGGKRSTELQKAKRAGIFGLTKEQRSLNTKRQWQDPEHRKMMQKVSLKAGKKCLKEGIGLFAPENLGKGAKVTNSTKWMDPEHPELGSHHFNLLKKIQREHGYPDKKENRVKVTIEDH